MIKKKAGGNTRKKRAPQKSSSKKGSPSKSIQKKSGPKKRSPKKRPQKRSNSKQKNNAKRKYNGIKSLFSVALLLVLVVSVLFLARFLFPPKHPPVHQSSTKQLPQKTTRQTKDRKPRTYQRPTYEVFPEKDTPPPKKVIPLSPPSDTRKPRIAIIIDDLGYDRKMAKKFLDLDTVLTFSLLPNSPQNKRIAKIAHKKGIEIMLHLPMEPNEYPDINPGPGALLTSMSPDELARQLNENLNSIPYVKGVNNHMGSEMTSISTQMYQIFIILKKRDLYFVDSRTTPETLCLPSARLLEIPFAQRDVFLDHIQEPKAIREQMNRLIDLAVTQGEAVGIGHPHPDTYEVLMEMLPKLKTKIEFVPASEIVRIIGS